jgi:hypothetical protein
MAQAESMLQLAHAALVDAGHPELCEYVTLKEGESVPWITSPCPKPHTVAQAVALAHQAMGHLVIIHRVEGAAGFDCVDCDLESDHG